ncbi:MAG: serpin family protein [Tannerella sp.]|jgi:serpin B|nr:serpin family protein [Tannerella sp.]
MKKKSIILMLCVVAGLYACTSADEVANTKAPPASVKEPVAEMPLTPREDIVLTRGEQAVVTANHVFAFDLLRRVSGDEPESNLLISPLSLSLAMAMLNNGADGATQAEIQQALGGGDLTHEDINGYFRKIVTAMQELDPSVSFESANSIWAAEWFPILETFIEINRTCFDAEARNFSDVAAGIKQINDWCNEKTHGMIPKVLDDGDEGVVYLLNALYFKGPWTLPFDESLTKDAPFAHQNGATSPVPMMRFEGPVQLMYGRTETFELLELPYGNEAFGMTLLLPAEGVSAASVVEGLDAAAWDAALSGMHAAKVEVRLPRFKTDYTRVLNEDLKALGIKSMFEDADFSLLTPEPLTVSIVLQKTAIELKEEGTEAAAVTLIIMVGALLGGGGGPAVIPVVEFNRPFIYFIKEKSTGSIVFSGIIQNL